MRRVTVRGVENFCFYSAVAQEPGKSSEAGGKLHPGIDGFRRGIDVREPHSSQKKACMGHPKLLVQV